MYFILYFVAGYRKKVVHENLSKSFPHFSDKEIHLLAKKSYKNLTDIIVEGIKGFTLTDRQIIKRHKIINPEIVKPFLEAGKSIIAVPAHYGNWEWGALSPGLQIEEYKIVGFYKPLSNKYINRLLQNNRSRTGTRLQSIYETSKTFENFKDTPTVYIMAADQSPSNKDKAYWVEFLGRKTAFLHGPEKYARMYDIPVLFADIKRVKRGYYELYLSVIAEDPSKLDEGVITKEYAGCLEAVIRKKPENWLWSHRRWKLNE